MGYTLGQYTKFDGDGKDSSFIQNGITGEALRENIKSNTIDNLYFVNECVKINNTFKTDNNYYFHCKIKRQESSMIFDVKLVTYNPNPDPTLPDYQEQFLKTIMVDGGPQTDEHASLTLEDTWVDFEFIFTPFADDAGFDTILFELRRDASDYQQMQRHPEIIYEELGIIKNVIGNENGISANNLIRIGVQSHPGLLMCINGEEIRVCKSGIYELKNGVIKVSFFSVVAAAATTDDTKTVMTNINTDVNEIMKNESLTYAEKEVALSALYTKYKNDLCRFNETKTRQIDSFILDYLYGED